MKKQIKKQWAKVLPDYPQAEGSLVEKVDGVIRYCCLGVLCDLAIKAGLDTVRIREWTDELWKGEPLDRVAVEVLAFSEKGEPHWAEHTGGDLPLRVQQWAGLDNSNPTIDGIEAIERNDTHSNSFKKIAKHIRKDKSL